MPRWVRQVFFMELRKLITYRADFWVNYFGQTFFSLIIAYFLWSSIFEFTGKESMQGYTMQAMIFYYLVAPLIFRIQQGTGIGFASREIYDGQLSKYLLYPINFYTYKFATYFAHSVFYILQLFLIMTLYQLFFYDPAVFSFTLVGTLTFIVAVTMACVMFYFLFTLTEFLAFWFDNIWSLGVILRFGASFLGGALIPLKFFPEWSRDLLAMTPFPYMIDFPVRCLTGNMGAEEFVTKLGISFIWTGIFFLISKQIWKRGQYKYSGVGI